MHNTLNPLYKYISRLIVEFFTNQQIKPGDRYNLYLEERSYVQQLSEAFQADKLLDIQSFAYKHPSGNAYFESFSISINQTKVLIASSENATEDYFTMLRNNVSEQTSGFEDTALFIIYNQKLESISGGSENLEKDGMPLHYLNVRGRIERDITNNTELKYHEKEILKTILQYKTKSVLEDNNSIFDYEAVINTFYKGKIDPQDYRTLGLFPYDELASKGAVIKQDIEENHKLFNEIESIFQNGNPEIELKDRIPDNQLSSFIKGDWKATDYSDISKWLETEQNKTVPEILNISSQTDTITLWQRPEGTTATKRRQYNCIIFNPNKQDSVKLEVKFDQYTKKEGIHYRGNELSVTTSRHNLIITFPKYNETTVFHLVEYRDPDSGKRFYFKILHVPFHSNYFTQFETSFLIRMGANNSLSLKDDNILIFNEGAEILVEEDLEADKNYVMQDNTSLKLNCDYGAIDEEEVIFGLTIEHTLIPIHIKPDIETPKPITGLEVWREKRIYQTDFKFKQENEVIKIQRKSEQQERTVSGEFRKNLILEKYLTESESYSWEENSNGSLSDIALELDDQIKTVFDEFRTIFRSKAIQPSLAHLNIHEREIAKQYVRILLDYLKGFPENKPLTIKQKNIFSLGVIRENSGARRLKLSPYHPLNVAYQLHVNEMLGEDKDCYNAILKRLRPDNLLPYIEGKSKEIYIPSEFLHSPEWMCYSIYSDTKQGISKSYVADLVSSKLKDFKNNYSILFNQSYEAPIRINVMNQGDCKDVLHGIFEFYRTELNTHKDKRLDELLPIEIFIYGSENIVNKFEELTFYTAASEIEAQLEISLKTNTFDKEDLLNAFFEKVNFYSRSIPKENEDFEYAHITFYQFDTQRATFSYNEMSDVKTGLSLNSLLSDVSFMPSKDTYRTGFGTRDLPEQTDPLTELATGFNALAKVAANDDPYDPGKALCTTINYNIKRNLEKLYHQSHWVVYIDPRVDLDFFKENSDLVIIHSNDQYTNSSGYDAITVTRKVDPYALTVREFLAKHKVTFDAKEDTISIINFFNAVNGDWLLRLVRQQSQFPKEKLSLLSGIKTALAFLHHPCIIWVPVSLEEILRISGNAKLNKEEGLFSTKNLGGMGSYSDDLLMIGLEQKNNELLMHFYPIEMKIGGLNIVNKGKIQGEKTAQLLHEHLSKEGFIAEFYKNFFAKLVLTSAEKMKLFQIWDYQHWSTILEHYRTQLLNNQFIISRDLHPYIGDYGLIYFGNNTMKRSLQVSERCMHIELMENDGYNFLVQSVDDLIQFFHYTPTTVDTNKLLYTTYNCTGKSTQLVPTTEFSDEQRDIPRQQEDEIRTDIKESKVSANGMHILFGTDLNTQQPVIWEPNNSDKVMHTNTGIIGTMGTGKTQFTKSLITQMYKNEDQNPGNEKLGILIFDYKGDYVKEDFVQATNAKVFEPHQLPYNPLALDATAQSKPMLPLHTANDIKETIANAFNLGNVQKQKLRDIIVKAYESKGIERGKKDTWTNPSPTLGDVCNIFLADPGIPQDSLYAAISNLSDFEIFESDPTKTQSLYSLIEGVVVINLSGYDESIQNLIVAITLDAFYTQMQRHGHSAIENNLRQLRKIILVDEADNFLGKNFQSLKKILKEGREFGVGTVLSTQFLNHFATGENEYSNYILTWVIHRVNEIKMKEIESLFVLDNKVQKENLLKTIKGLEKHQSVVNLAGSGPLVIRDKAFWELEQK